MNCNIKGYEVVFMYCKIECGVLGDIKIKVYNFVIGEWFNVKLSFSIILFGY